MEDPTRHFAESPLHLHDGSKSCKSSQPVLAPFFPEADRGAYTVKNTFLHIDDDDDEDDDQLRQMDRIYSAPARGPNYGTKGTTTMLRSDEPMKVKRLGGDGETLLNGEKWTSGCLLEEADGSSVSCSWATRTKSAESIVSNNSNANAGDYKHLGENDLKEKDPHSTLSTIQEMFSQMYSSKPIPVKNSFVHYNDSVEEDKSLKKFKSAPVGGLPGVNREFSPGCAAIIPMPPVPESFSNTPAHQSCAAIIPSRPPSESYSLQDEVNGRGGAEEDVSRSEKSVEYVEIVRPWESGAKVPVVHDLMKKTRPPPGMKFLCTFVVGIHECPQFTVSRRIIGRGGENMKFISQLCTGTKLRLRGKGSGFRERDSNAEADVPLQVNLSSPFREEYELSKREMSSLLNSIYRDYKRLFGKEIRVKLNEHPKNPK